MGCGHYSKQPWYLAALGGDRGGVLLEGCCGEGATVNARVHYYTCVHAQSLSRVRLFVTPMTVVRWAPLSMGFSRQEYWSWLLGPPPGDLPNPIITYTFYYVISYHIVFILYYIDTWRRQWQATPVLLPRKSHGWRSLVGYSPWCHHESVATERLHFHFSLSRNGEGNGNPLQCSCLENPRDGGAWWAAVYGVAQSQT